MSAEVDQPGVNSLPPVQPNGDSALQVRTCWSDIGVYGNSSCGELEKYVHCRNCPVYSGAGQRLLDRALPVGYRQNWTQHFGVVKREQEAGGVPVVVFRVGQEWFGLPAQALQEIAERRPIHSLPHRRQGIVLGLANVRGELLICVSFGHLLGMDTDASSDQVRSAYERLLVVSWDDSRFALPVEQVDGPRRFREEDINAPPAGGIYARHSYLRGVIYWEERTMGLIEIEPLFAALNRSLA